MIYCVVQTNNKVSLAYIVYKQKQNLINQFVKFINDDGDKHYQSLRTIKMIICHICD